jgi:hypothetical protein
MGRDCAKLMLRNVSEARTEIDLCNVGLSRFAIRAIMTGPGTYE